MHLGYGSNGLFCVNNFGVQFINGALENLGTVTTGYQLSKTLQFLYVCKYFGILGIPLYFASLMLFIFF